MQYDVQILRSPRKTLAIQVISDHQVVVRSPLRMKNAAIEAFLESHQEWIALHLQKAAQREKEKRQISPFSQEELSRLSEQAHLALPPLCAQYAEKMSVRYQRVTIRCQRTRWGSCSRKGNLNFNCLLMLCPPSVREYVIVHELCHLKEMNHSPRFWREVKAALPDYEASRRWLKTEGQRLIDRLT